MRVQRQATHAMWQVQAIRSANVRADAIVLNSALSAYAHNRPPLRTPARQCRAICNAGAFRPPRSPTASSRHYVVIPMLIGHGVLGHEPLSVCEVA